ncbi:hypothetical protein [Fluviispira multicolorata]|uniref:Uncharacterized protein n=1 Tax=Fluviispira multicolorata TaxID=2654512 RepID=A0A833N852_9BACT|nr:hypothetical protein [Fluviispira multicolorata]KAB8033641.1 hypothetical protein GCL57_02735 [Fluviispira multicolorata]
MKKTFILITTIGIITFHGANAYEINYSKFNTEELYSKDNLNIKNLKNSSLNKLWEADMPINLKSVW